MRSFTAERTGVLVLRVWIEHDGAGGLRFEERPTWLMVDRAFVFTYAIQLLVVAVTLAGIFDLLTTQIIERRREVGVFRALGADKSHIARAIRLEAVAIGVVGALLGAMLAVGTSLMWVRVNFRILIGYILEHHFAALTACWCVLLAAGVAMIAGQLAGRGALREPVLDTLRSE